MTVRADASELKKRLDEDGYVVVEDIFDPDRDFSLLYEDWNKLLDGVVDEMIDAGTMKNRYESLDFCDRYMAVCAEAKTNFPRSFDISMPLKNIRPDTPVYAGQGVFNVLTHKRMLDVVEALVGPEITSNPIQHVRMKLPTDLVFDNGPEQALVAASPFHQDEGVSLPEADESDILTCWVAITDATEELACMQIYPRTAHETLIRHCPAGSPALGAQRGRGIPPKLMPAEQPTPVPIRSGGALFFKGRLVHGSFDNFSPNRMRISLDLRYQVSGRPTGRPGFPEFVARSHDDPSRELRDWKQWQKTWHEARERLSIQQIPEYYRWDANAADCA